MSKLTQQKYTALPTLVIYTYYMCMTHTKTYIYSQKHTHTLSSLVYSERHTVDEHFLPGTTSDPETHLQSLR